MGKTRKSTMGTGMDKEVAANTAAPSDTATAQPRAVGRKRDASRNQAILDATLQVLGEIGFDSMTMDMVAARAGAGKATLYRRWPSKAEVVRDALIGMSRNSIEVDHLPDTGNLRDDLLAVMKPPSLEYSERKLRVLAGLGSFSTQHRRLYDEALTGIFEPWIRINTKLMQRAIERRELPATADVPLACEIIVSMTAFRTSTQLKKFDRASYATLLDHFVLPGLATERPIKSMHPNL